jgi:hypothetical protein
VYIGQGCRGGHKAALAQQWLCCSLRGDWLQDCLFECLSSTVVWPPERSGHGGRGLEVAAMFCSLTISFTNICTPFCCVLQCAGCSCFECVWCLNALRGSASCGWLLRIVTWCSAAPTYMSACRTTATGAVLHTAGAGWCGQSTAVMSWVRQAANNEAWSECRACLCQHDTGV